MAAVDPESNRLTYSLTGTDADAFTIVASSGQLRTKDALDYETKSSYSVTVNVRGTQSRLLRLFEGGGGTTGLFECQGRRTSLAEGGGPPADGVSIPAQCLGSGRGGHAPAQEPQSVPPFSFPRRRRQVHPAAHTSQIQLPPLQVRPYPPHTHPHSARSRS